MRGLTTAGDKIFVCNFAYNDEAEAGVYVFDLTGRLVAMWDRHHLAFEGTSAVLLSLVLHAPTCQFFATDYNGDRVLVLCAKSGRVLRGWGKPGNGFGEFQTPCGLAIARDLVFIADTGNARVQVFRLDGTFVTAFGDVGEGPGRLVCPDRLATDGEYVYVSDNDAHCIQVFRLDGSYSHAWGAPGSTNGAFADPEGLCVIDGCVYVCQHGLNRLQVWR